jgi:hypothetical protein
LLIPGSSAIAILDGLPQWRRLYSDRAAVVHVYTGQKEEVASKATGTTK